MEETEGLCDQQGEERLREEKGWLMVLELEWGQIGSIKVWVWEVSLALRYPRVFLAAESVDLGLGEDQARDGGLGTPAAIALSGYSMEVINPHRWDPRDLCPRVWRLSICFLQGGCCSSAKPAPDPSPGA